MTGPIAMLLAAVVTPIAAVAQEWKVYPYPEAGFAVQFPAPPEVEKSTFRTSSGASLALTRYAVRQDRIVYTMEVVDFSSVNADGMSTIAEREALWRIWESNRGHRRANQSGVRARVERQRRRWKSLGRGNILLQQAFIRIGRQVVAAQRDRTVG